jgi:lysophospholipase L1-like esterase
VTRRVVCLGDSITRGQLSVDYVAMLSERKSLADFTFVNAGVNGELAENVLRRLDEVIDLAPDVVTVLIGSNDVNVSMSEKSARRAMRMNKLSARPTIEGFADNLAAIVDRLAAETSTRIGLFSPPVLGEEVGSESVRRSQRYSEVVRQTAEKRGVTYLPLNERQVARLIEGGFRPGTAYRDGVGLMVGGAFQHFVLRRRLDEISRRRGLELTTDLLHQNTRGAAMIADLAEEFLLACTAAGS